MYSSIRYFKIQYIVGITYQSCSFKTVFHKLVKLNECLVSHLGMKKVYDRITISLEIKTNYVTQTYY